MTALELLPPVHASGGGWGGGKGEKIGIGGGRGTENVVVGRKNVAECSNRVQECSKMSQTRREDECMLA